MERAWQAGGESKGLAENHKNNCRLNQSDVLPRYRPQSRWFCCTNINKACPLNLKIYRSPLFSRASPSCHLPFSSRHILSTLCSSAFFPLQSSSSSKVVLHFPPPVTREREKRKTELMGRHGRLFLLLEWPEPCYTIGLELLRTMCKGSIREQWLKGREIEARRRVKGPALVERIHITRHLLCHRDRASHFGQAAYV